MTNTIQALTTSNATTRTRRAFLRQGTLAGLAVAVFGQTELLAATLQLNGQAKKGPFPVPAEARAKQLVRSTFTPHLSEYFETANNNGDPVQLLLLAIDDLPVQQKLLLEGRFSETEARQSREESFALTFRGPGEWPLRQRAYMLSHPKLGKLELFLVAVGKVEKDPAWRDYEAVFNRMH